MTGLTKEETHSIRKSYLNIVASLLGEEQIHSKYLRCLLKWGLQLKLQPEDLRRENIDLAQLTFSIPLGQLEKVEAIYHLVHMICLDRVVEDAELEVAGLYAQKLGFRPSLVSELLKSIITADSDGQGPMNIREQVMDFLKTYDD